MIIQSLVLSQNASLIVFKKALVMRVTMVAIDRSGVGLEPATVGAGRNTRRDARIFRDYRGPDFLYLALFPDRAKKSNFPTWNLERSR